MSFVKREYVDQQTVITAENMNAIQDELLRLGVSEGSLWNSVTSAGTTASNALDNEAAAYNYHLQYHVGDYCLYQQKLYRCTVETPAAGETWNSSHWTAVTVGDEMIETASELSELRNTLNHKADVIYDTASGDIASFPDGADGLPVKDLTVGIEPVQSGTGDPSPTNVRPISGWTGANVTRTGKNLLNPNSWENGQYIDDTWSESTARKTSPYIRINPNAIYTASIDSDQTKGLCLLNYNYFDESRHWLGNRSTNGEATFAGEKTHSFSISNTSVKFVRITIRADDGSSIVDVDVSQAKAQLELGSTRTAYEPFGTTIPISWQSSAGTVYGGTLDVTSGVLTVDRAKTTVDAFEWDMNATTHQFFARGIKDATTRTLSILSSCFATIDSREPYDSSWNNVIYNVKKNNPTAYTLYVQTTEVTTVEDFLSAFGTSEIVYYLETPLVIQLDPVTVTTLLGQNNIWSDTGSSTVEYPADTKLYIERLTAPEEDDMIANQNIASGVYFMVGNNLYLSTAAILAGDPIKPGTNCTLTNLAAALNALNS